MGVFFLAVFVFLLTAFFFGLTLNWFFDRHRQGHAVETLHRLQAVVAEQETALTLLRREYAALEPLPREVEALKAALAEKEVALLSVRRALNDLHAMHARLVPSQPIDASGHTDDLKRIAGVGPVTEQHLHVLGLFTFSQLARLTEAQATTLALVLGPLGHALQSDDWIGQARRLHRDTYGTDP